MCEFAHRREHAHPAESLCLLQRNKVALQINRICRGPPKKHLGWRAIRLPTTEFKIQWHADCLGICD
jgi:hypothetical protein